ncbi:DNA adenine methylase [Chelatococcus sp.]|uniref:DNA adenine methylase n=1 Tax=Chelatococcus sp. TaxID=1953771 RepID=UPI001EC934A6|nr:DNA adenine methylase [Chelatococcus sp.]MBX3545610.1 DNA adenine methylase [Chelatococcus sp.]
MHDGMRAVRPIRPAAGYVGGKKQLANRLAERIAAVPHETYCEAFVGMGGVFFKRQSAPKVEVINDLNRDVATFFRVLQRHYQAFMDMLKWQLTSRAEFARLIEQAPDTLTDLERSARFLYLQRLSFGGKVAGRTFGIDTRGPARFDVTKLAPLLEAAHERLAGVWIECLDWEAFIARWDRPHTLFFLDPPYWGSEHYYGRGAFVRDDFARLAATLKALRGRFVLTLNDVPEVRALFEWAELEAVGLTYSVGGNDAPKATRELIISGP